MEERGEIVGADKTHRWIVDPLDGTTNFLHGIPLFAISIALEREGQLVAGVIYNPIMDELYTAEKGKGAFLNDRRLRVAARRTLAGQRGDDRHSSSRPRRTRAVLSANAGRRCARCPGSDGPAPLASILPGLRQAGSTPIGNTGSSRGTWRPGSCCCARQAGLVTDLKGGQAMFESGGIAVGNSYVHKQLAGLAGTGVGSAESAGQVTVGGRTIGCTGDSSCRFVMPRSLVNLARPTGGGFVWRSPDRAILRPRRCIAR